jgi:urea transporter
LFTVIAQGASAGFMQQIGIPPLTFPFVVATWIFLLVLRGD